MRIIMHVLILPVNGQLQILGRDSPLDDRHNLHLKRIDRQLLQLACDVLGIRPEIDQGCQRHVSGDAGEAIKI